MSTAEIAAHLAHLTAQIEARLQSGQTPSNRGHLRLVRNQLNAALGAMGLVNHNAGIAAQQAGR